ncbi:hypothetical protein EQO05_14195 [Methanosarcina sp. MSH10X1]|uniref:hypothetical protein n=1 Tax=Methanosarcina sp. MSH10X1 TaxID=2507075 RepID=UPI000FFC4842|nr:hypothetical protein [Methanosarcina sp. MSH10X1]RXA16297.1 hypothetical protein EQO05_14195 [Methanosarcina sp. MSH10X1]
MPGSQITMDSRWLKLVASCFFLFLSSATSLGFIWSVILGMMFFILLKISPFNKEWVQTGYDEARELKKEYETMLFIIIGTAIFYGFLQLTFNV